MKKKIINRIIGEFPGVGFRKHFPVQETLLLLLEGKRNNVSQWNCKLYSQTLWIPIKARVWFTRDFFLAWSQLFRPDHQIRRTIFVIDIFDFNTSMKNIVIIHFENNFEKELKNKRKMGLNIHNYTIALEHSLKKQTKFY